MVDARVVSANTPSLVALDAVLKGFSIDAGNPLVLSGAPACATCCFTGDEHGALTLPEGTTLPPGNVVTLGLPTATQGSISVTPSRGAGRRVARSMAGGGARPIALNAALSGWS
jgi:hypothetical protein